MSTADGLMLLPGASVAMRSAPRGNVDKDSHQSLAYRADIDGLRAIAIIAVVVFHAFPSVMPGGFVGVDIFFVISGYLIAGVIFEEIRSGTFRMSQFYRRRVLRLFPALGLVLAASLVIGGICLRDDEYYQLAKHAFAGTFGFANVTLWSEAGYFDLPSKTKPLLHLWSLGVEEQFYLVFPISIVLLTRNRGRVMTILLSVFILSFLLDADLFGFFSRQTRFFLPQFRAWELMAGAILAHRARHIELGRFADAVAVTGCAAILSSLLLLRGDQFSALGVLPAVAGTAAIIAAGKTARINRTLLANRGVVFVGLISYPLYLWHWPLICFFNILHPEMGIVSRVILIGVSVLTATLTYRYVERSARGAASKRTLVPAFLIGAMACVSAVAVAIVI